MLLRLPTLGRVTKNKNYFFILCYGQVNVWTWDLPNIRHQWYPHNCAVQFQQEEWSWLSRQLTHETTYQSQKWFSLNATCCNNAWRAYHLLNTWLENAGAAQEGCGERAFTFLRYFESWEWTAQWSHKIKSLFGNSFWHQMPFRSARISFVINTFFYLPHPAVLIKLWSSVITYALYHTADLLLKDWHTIDQYLHLALVSLHQVNQGR
jgi:hypothetical protein